MNRTETVRAFVAAFAAGDRDGLIATMTPDVRFEGPYLSCTGRTRYVDAVCSPGREPTGAAELVEVSETDDMVIAVYRLYKVSGVLEVHQVNRFRDGRIAHIEVRFDPAEEVRGFAPTVDP